LGESLRRARLRVRAENEQEMDEDSGNRVWKNEAKETKYAF
jgi:hypothetical protein